MNELDIEALKAVMARRDQLEVGAPGWLTANLAVARHVDGNLIAALEDRERLRAAAHRLLNQTVAQRPEFDELRATLEGRDG